MGRPRQGTDLKIKLSIRLSPQALARIDARGNNRSAVIEALALGTDLRAQLDAKIATIAPNKPYNTGACTHPKTARQIHSWGATCGDCNTRLP